MRMLRSQTSMKKSVQMGQGILISVDESHESGNALPLGGCKR